jgi:hypothetical protein
MRAECPIPRPGMPHRCDTRADDVGGPGLCGLRLSPDQRPWQLPLRVSVRLLRGGSKRWRSGGWGDLGERSRHNPVASDAA